MKFSTIFRWIGPAAIAGGLFMVLSDLSGLPVYIPYLSQGTPTGYGAVGGGLILFAMMLLLVGMIGLYARRPDPDGPKVIEYGDGRGRYILVERLEEERFFEEDRILPGDPGADESLALCQLSQI